MFVVMETMICMGKTNNCKNKVQNHAFLLERLLTTRYKSFESGRVAEDAEWRHAFS